MTCMYPPPHLVCILLEPLCLTLCVNPNTHPNVSTAVWRVLKHVSARTYNHTLRTHSQVLLDKACTKDALFWMSPLQGGDGNCGCFTSGHKL